MEKFGIKMTAEQEIQILQYLTSYTYDLSEDMSSGSARVCFSIDEDMQNNIRKILGIEDNDNTPFVVKVAMGVGGQTQSNREIAAFLQYGDTYPLARIIAYGRFIELMEEVQMLPEEYREYDNWSSYDDRDAYFCYIYYNDINIDEWYEMTPEARMALPEFQERHQEYDKAISAIGDLEYLFDETGDNGQLGVNVLGDIVCYDYGFLPNSDEEWSSSLTDHIYDNEFLAFYFTQCIDNIDSQEEINYALEKTILHDYLKAAITTSNDDDDDNED